MRRATRAASTDRARTTSTSIATSAQGRAERGCLLACASATALRALRQAIRRPPARPLPSLHFLRKCRPIRLTRRRCRRRPHPRLPHRRPCLERTFTAAIRASNGNSLLVVRAASTRATTVAARVWPYQRVRTRNSACRRSVLYLGGRVQLTPSQQLATRTPLSSSLVATASFRTI